MNQPVHVDWYFDFISPFAYLQLEQFHRLPPHVRVTLKPVVLGALLSHWGAKGPAEIPGKRRFTYRYAQFRAEQLGLPFRMPPAHPFQPIHLLRLAILLECRREAVQAIFRFLWREGLSADTDDGWRALGERLGRPVPVDALGQSHVKLALRGNTEQAIARGVFGVPTFAWGDELFWGEDATSLLLHCLEQPRWLQSQEVRRISTLPLGIERAV